MYLIKNSTNISRPTLALILLSALCCLLEFFKVILKNDLSGLGLIWNLFLAWLPLGFVLLARRLVLSHTSLRMVARPSLRGTKQSASHGSIACKPFSTTLTDCFVVPPRNDGRAGSFQTFKLYFSLLLWLLFFPNSTYIITDLMHVPEYSGRLLWYDSLRIFLFALAGLAAGLYSLLVAHQVFNQLFKVRFAWFLLSLSVLLSGYGIYLGRFERFNSWDLFTNPFSLIQQIRGDLHNQLAIQTTLAFATVTMVLYVCLRLISPPTPDEGVKRGIF